MYSVADYARMIACDPRRRAYTDALREVVTKDTTVLDLGAGTGFFSLFAASLGAKHVVAIEKNPAIAVGRRAAAVNGFSERITFLHARAEDATLPPGFEAGFDVIVSDLRGMLPLNRPELAASHFAKTHFLAKDGVFIPATDRLFVAGVEAPAGYARLTRGFSQEALGITFDISAGRAHAVNDAYQDHGQWIPEGGLATTAATWASVAHGEAPPERIDESIALHVTRACTLHGYCVWFEADLLGRASQRGQRNTPGFATSVGNDLPYGRAFLPLEAPISVRDGETIDLRMGALSTNEDYLLSWQTQHGDVSFAQSMLFRSADVV